MFPSMNTQSVSIHVGAVTDAPAGGLKVGFFEAARAIQIVDAYAFVRTAVGAGTIGIDLLDGAAGAGTVIIGSIGTATALVANTPTAFTLTSTSCDLDAGDCVLVQVKGDGTLDLVDFQVQLDYVYGGPAGYAAEA